MVDPSTFDQQSSDPAPAEADLRYEVKLVCDGYRLAQVRSWVRLHAAGFGVAYPPRQVNSLYLDTLHLGSLRGNLDGISGRQKLRLRWYGAGVTEIQPALELKQKRNLVGRKRRYPLPCRLDLTRPWVEILRTVRAQAGPEWQVVLQTVDQPTLLTSYRREYYVTSDGAIRVTLDYAQAAYEQRLAPRPNLRVRLPMADTVVLEVKGGLEQAGRLEEVAGGFPVLRSRNSKYVRGLMAALG